MESRPHFHRPVMLDQVLEFMNINSGGVYLDLTFGGGGHSEKILELGAAKVVGVDRDLRALNAYRETMPLDGRLELFHSKLSDFVNSERSFDGVLVDLGVSSQQFLSKERGFSVKLEGPLDMRMDDSQGESLSQILERISEEDLADAIFRNTGLGKSRRISKKILGAYRRGELKTTLDLARILGGPMGARHPATVPFLGLRMMVNEELKEIRAIESTLDQLKPGGRLVVLTFHSVEDREVKWLFKKTAQVQKVKILTKKPVIPTKAELLSNPRARSAKLRCVEKI